MKSKIIVAIAALSIFAGSTYSIVAEAAAKKEVKAKVAKKAVKAKSKATKK